MDEHLKSFTLDRINREAVPTIYGGVLLYKNGDENANAALHMSNIIGLVEAGVDVIIDDSVEKEITKDETDQIDLAKERRKKYLEELEKLKANKS